MINLSSGAGVIWITGYSGAGKTTVGRAVEYQLRNRGVRSVFLDGDDLRGIFGNRWGYSREERIELAKIYFRLCSHLSSQGITVVIAAVAMYSEVRRWLREYVSNSAEIYLSVPNQIRRQRDSATKQVYKSNESIEALYDEPIDADLVINNFANITPDDAAKRIVDYFSSPDFIWRSDKGRHSHWNVYYESDQAPDSPSSFAQLVCGFLQNKPMKILEVGCGNGRDAAFFYRSGHHVTAIDPSHAAIEACLRKYGDSFGHFLCGAIGALDKELPADHFDIAYSRFCLHAMTYDEEADFVVRTHRTLKAFGRLFIECRSINDPLARKGEILSPTERIYGHYRRFIVLDELIQKLTEHGFSIVSAEELRGVSVLGDDNPAVIRLVAIADKPSLQ